MGQADGEIRHCSDAVLAWVHRAVVLAYWWVVGESKEESKKRGNVAVVDG